MDVEQVNSVLIRAILAFQEREIEEMIEATAYGVSSYEVPSPKISKPIKVKKITEAMVKRALKKEKFRLDHTKEWFSRSAEVSPGVYIVERKWAGEPVKYEYRVQVYQGKRALYRWQGHPKMEVSLKEAIAWANEHAQEAADHVAAEKRRV